MILFIKSFVCGRCIAKSHSLLLLFFLLSWLWEHHKNVAKERTFACDSHTKNGWHEKKTISLSSFPAFFVRFVVIGRFLIMFPGRKNKRRILCSSSLLLCYWVDVNRMNKRSRKKTEKNTLSERRAVLLSLSWSAQKNLNEWNMCHATKHVTQIVTIYKIYFEMKRIKRHTNNVASIFVINGCAVQICLSVYNPFEVDKINFSIFTWRLTNFSSETWTWAKWWWWWRRQRRLERRSFWMWIFGKLSSTYVYDEDEEHFRERQSFLSFFISPPLFSVLEHSFSIISNVFIWNRFNSERVLTSNRNFLFCLSGVSHRMHIFVFCISLLCLRSSNDVEWGKKNCISYINWMLKAKEMLNKKRRLKKRTKSA